MKIKVKTIIPLFSLVTGIVWVVYGLTEYGFWHPVKGPVVGFVPTIMAVALIVVSILGLIKSRKEKDEPDRLENWTILLASCIAFSLVFLVGMLASLLIFVLVWLRFYEKESWKNTIISLIIAFAIVYGVFMLWLKVSFPNGLILDMILG